MKFDAVGALLRKLASAPLTWGIAIGASFVAYAAFRRRSRSRRRRGSIRPIGYYSYITHSALPAVCATCGVEASGRTRKFCLSNPKGSAEWSSASGTRGSGRVRVARRANAAP